MVGRDPLKAAKQAKGPRKKLRFEIFLQTTQEDGNFGNTKTARQYWWRMTASNGQVIGNSAEGFKTKAHAKRIIGKISAHILGGDVEVVDFC